MRLTPLTRGSPPRNPQSAPPLSPLATALFLLRIVPELLLPQRGVFSRPLPHFKETPRHVLRGDCAVSPLNFPKRPSGLCVCARAGRHLGHRNTGTRTQPSSPLTRRRAGGQARPRGPPSTNATKGRGTPESDSLGARTVRACSRAHRRPATRARAVSEQPGA